MAREIKITKRKPTEVLNIVENNYRIKRSNFGELTDNRLKLLSYLNKAWVSSTFIIICWLTVHILFVHPQFHLDLNEKNKSSFRQYTSFLLQENWTYSFIGVQLLIIGRYVYMKIINKVKVSNEI